MPTWLIALIIGIGITTWAYNKLAKLNGNASPGSNFALASVAGVVMFIVVFSLMKMVLGS